LRAAAARWKGFPLAVYRSYTQPRHRQAIDELRQFGLYFARTGDYSTALSAQEKIVDIIDNRTKDWKNLDQRFSWLAQAKSDLSAPFVMKTTQGQALFKRVQSLLAAISAEHQKRECLAVAAKLDETAGRLEDKDLFAKAAQLYRESFEIKAKNLGMNNAETLSSIVALAHALSFEQKYKDADLAFQKALGIYHANKSFQDRSYVTLLESYAQMLAAANEKTKADKIYEEARTYYRWHDAKAAQRSSTIK